MLSLYLDSLITGHTFGNMISTLYKLKVQRRNGKYNDKSCVMDTQHEKNKPNNAIIIILARAGNCTRDFLHRSLMRYLHVQCILLQIITYSQVCLYRC